ncbi:MAG: 3'-5' exonuclease, partial [Flavobacteriaceae bacterium]
FVEGQKELADATASLTEYLEDVALATDMDNDKGNDAEKVSLMTIHLAKGLEFPYVYIVGMEEDLFPSAMSMNTRSELEEERRLFYVALTRAEKQAYLTYTLSRYRWGKLIDAEPSRFIEEIDEQYLEFITPPIDQRVNPMLDPDIFGDAPDSNTFRFKKPSIRRAKKQPPKFIPPKKLKPVANVSKSAATNLFDGKLTVGNIVEHMRFGKGEVLKLEGKGPDTKAEINFEHGGIKKLLLRFAKLSIIG